MKRSPLKRGSPLKRSTPLRSKSTTLAKARKLRQDVLARDQGCVAVSPTLCDGPLDVAHIFPRRLFAAKDVYNPDSCALLCRTHHRMWDARGERLLVFINPPRIRAARLLLDNAKVKR